MALISLSMVGEVDEFRWASYVSPDYPTGPARRCCEGHDKHEDAILHGLVLVRDLLTFDVEHAPEGSVGALALAARKGNSST